MFYSHSWNKPANSVVLLKVMWLFIYQQGKSHVNEKNPRTINLYFYVDLFTHLKKKWKALIYNIVSKYLDVNELSWK